MAHLTGSDSATSRDEPRGPQEDARTYYAEEARCRTTYFVIFFKKCPDYLWRPVNRPVAMVTYGLWLNERMGVNWKWARGNFWGDGHVLKLDCGNGCIIHTIIKNP